MIDEPRLRGQLDRELAGLTTTPQARRRFLDALPGPGRAGATGPAGRRPALTAPARSRWPVAAAVAAVTAMVLLPGAVAGYLQLGPQAPAGTATAGAGAGSPGTPSPSTAGATVGPTAASTSIRPDATAFTGRYLDLEVPQRRVRSGDTVVVRVVTADSPPAVSTPTPAGPSPAGTAEQEPSSGPADPSETPATQPAARQPAVPQPGIGQPATGQPAARRSAVTAVAPGEDTVPAEDTVAPSPAPAARSARVSLDWGDGTVDDDRVTCPAAAGERVEPMTFRHVYRRPGTYVVVLAVGPDGCWAAPARRTVTVEVS